MRRVLAPLALALLAGCGRQHHKTTPQLPPADRVAFYQLATVDGLVRSRAVVSDERGTIRVSQPDVDDSRRRLARTKRKRCPEAGEPAADDAHVGVDLAHERFRDLVVECSCGLLEPPRGAERGAQAKVSR